MILTAPNGVTYAVHFHHHTLGTRRATSCTVHEGKCVDKQPSGPCLTSGAVSAIAECSVKDRFDKLKGRKIALSRALHEVVPAKAVRAALWQDFLSKTHPVAKAA